MEEIANRERIVNVISYYSLLFIHYPAKFLFMKVIGHEFNRQISSNVPISTLKNEGWFVCGKLGH